MIERLTLKSGQQSIRINGRHYHSSYNPVKEAERFVATTIGDSSPSTIIICGAGIGYLIKAVQNRFPVARIISLFYSEELAQACEEKNKITWWHPKSREDIVSFLRESLSELDIEGLQTIEWPAGVSLYPEISKMAHLHLTQVIKEKRGSMVTSMAMGRLWIKNSFHNFIHFSHVYKGFSIPRQTPIVLAASGPSLQHSLKPLQKWRNRICIIALPSAVTCLLANNIIPDIIVMTDPGYYARLHLQWVDISSCCVYMPLSAATGLEDRNTKICLFSQPHFFEDLLLEKTGNSFFSVPPRGTVAATAMEIAMHLSSSHVIIAGLDLCYKDILSHARPHAFDPLFIQKENRLSPFYHEQFSRALHFAPEYNRAQNTRTSLSLKTYEGWFQSLTPGVSKRLIRVQPSPVYIPRTHALPAKELGSILSAHPVCKKKEKMKKIDPYPALEIRKKIVIDVIETWKSKIQAAGKRIREINSLTPLICSQEVLQLIYFLNLKELTSIKRTLRLKGESAGMEDSLAMLDDAFTFLAGYQEKVKTTFLKQQLEFNIC
jgi:hypothetical protein